MDRTDTRGGAIGENLLARFRFPEQARHLPLYARLSGDVRLDRDAGGFTCAEGGEIDGDSYFNALPEGRLRALCELGDVRVRLRLTGRFEVALWRRGFGCEPRELARAVFEGMQPAVLDVPAPRPDEQLGRVYVRLRCLSERGSFCGGEFFDNAAARPVALTVVVCTFGRERSVIELAGKLTGDPDLARFGVEVVVVDNGRTLAPADFASPKVTLIPSPNTGGSGGFSRGLLEVFSRPGATHALLMDDDVAIDTEAVLRAIVLLGRAKRPVAVCGAMLDWELPTQIYESGALAFAGADHPGPHPWRVLPLRHRLDASGSRALDGLCLPSAIDYGGFWFFALSVADARRAGLLLPFFLLGDDIEYGLRLKAMGVSLVEAGGAGVWHLPFYGKLDPAKHYLWTRNLLAVSAIRADIGVWLLVWRIVQTVFPELCKFRYDWAV
ncbi:MAG: glycosyltransferase family 2 protein, partial [Desulfovibrionaceae bacterium]|nr:glycosyltransferase family 2 protein [Desulfovibrionaceae bacterium]